MLIGYVLVGKWEGIDKLCEGCIKMEEKSLEWYVRNSVEPLIEGVKTAETTEYSNTVNKKEFKQNRMKEL